GAWGCCSALQAEASERARSSVLEATLAQAARPQAIVPLPAIAGRSYVSAPVTGRVMYHAARGGVELRRRRRPRRRRHTCTDRRGADRRWSGSALAPAR